MSIYSRSGSTKPQKDRQAIPLIPTTSIPTQQRPKTRSPQAVSDQQQQLVLAFQKWRDPPAFGVRALEYHARWVAVVATQQAIPLLLGYKLA